MKDPWRKTLELLRAYPALLTTLVGASLANFFLRWFNRIYPRWIFHWAATRHSVLGFETQSPDSWGVIQKKVILLSAPVSLCLSVATVGVYVAGFVLTARLVRDLIQSDQPDWMSALCFVRSRLFRVLGLAIAFFVLIALAIYLSSAFIYLRIFAPFRGDLSPTALLIAAEFLTMVCVAWIMTPFVLRLIRDAPAMPASPEVQMQGRIAAIAVAATSLALTELVESFRPSINFTFEAEVRLRSYLIWPLLSVLLDLPLLFLWVFLALLTYQELQMPEIPIPSPS